MDKLASMTVADLRIVVSTGIDCQTSNISLVTNKTYSATTT
jgi:hypothetical protein